MAAGTGLKPEELQQREEQAAQPASTFDTSNLAPYDPETMDGENVVSPHGGRQYPERTNGSKGIASKAETPEQLKKSEGITAGGNDETTQGVKDAFNRIAGANAQQDTSPGESRGNAFKRVFWANKKRKAATIGGSGGIVSVIVAIFSILGISSGPLEFIHIAQLLQGPLSVFGHVNATNDYRMGKMLYDIYKTGDIGKFDAGNTRIGVIGRAIKGPVINGLQEKGITIKFGTLKTFDGFTIDLKNPNNKEYYGLTQEEAITKLQTDIGNANKLNITFSESVPNEIFVSGTGFNGDAEAIRAVSAFMGDKYLGSPVASYIGSRFLMKYSAARTFHPLQKFLVQKQQDILDGVKAWWTSRNEEVATGETATTIDTTAAKDQTGVDKNGNPITEPAAGENGSLTAPEVSTKLGALKTGAGIAGGLSTVIAIICALQAIDKGIAAIRYVQVMLPMMREAMDAITIGSQVMSGKDVNINELNKLSTQLTTLDATTHKVTSVWSSSAPIESLAGQSGGTDLDPNTKSLFAGPPAWLSWTESGAVQTLCSTAVTIVGGVASIAIGIFSGEIASTVIGLAAGAIAGPLLINFLSNLLSGGAINPTTLSGAQWGGVVAYGARLAGNAQALRDGGVALTNQQVAELNGQTEAQSQTQFHSESLADRIFNPYDYRSVVGNTIDHLNLAGGPQTVLADITNLPALFGALLKMPATLVSATTGAAATPYQYPFPEFGFSTADLNNPAVQDPAQNAKNVGTILDNNNTNGEPDYIQKALDCFGVAVTKGADGWDAVPSTNNSSTNQDRARGVNAYDNGAYSQSDCTDTTDANWLRIRVFLLDTAAMEGYACYMGDQTSCNNNSFGGNTGQTAPPTNNGTGTGGNSTCMSTAGAGAFTDTTNTISTTLPYTLPITVQQMCQRAQALANQTNTGAVTNDPNHAAVFSNWCSRIPDSSTATGCASARCDYTASFIWGYGNSGFLSASANNNIPIGGISYHWNSILATYPTHAHPGDLHPPVGALLFYNNSIYGTGGHVTVYLGNNWLVSSDMGPTADGRGVTSNGRVAIVHTSSITDGPWLEKYLGWADPIITGGRAQ